MSCNVVSIIQSKITRVPRGTPRKENRMGKFRLLLPFMSEVTHAYNKAGIIENRRPAGEQC